MRRCMRVLTIALFIGMIGALCTGTGLAATKTLTFWHSFTQPERIDVMRQIADDFERLHNVKVNIEVVPWTKLDEKWTSALAANRLPDVSIVLPDTSVSMWSAGATLPVDGIIEDLGGREAFLSESLLDNFFSYQGKPVALPFYAHARVLLYREDLFKEKGINPPETWEEYVEAAAALTNPPDCYGMLQYWDKSDWGALAYLYLFMRSNEGCFFDKEGNVVFNSPENIEAVKQLVKLFDAGSIKGELGLAFHANVFDMFTSGRTAMVFDTTFMVNTVRLERPDLYEKRALGVTYPPYRKQHGWFADAIGVALMKGKNVELGEKFIEFLYEKENYVTFLHTVPGGQFPALKSVAESNTFWDNPVIEAYKDGVEITLEGISKGSPIGFENGPNPYASLLKTGIIEEMFHHIVAGGVSPEQAVAETHDELAKLVAAEKRRIDQKSR